MGGCASKPKDLNGQNPEFFLPAENPAVLDVTPDHSPEAAVEAKESVEEEKEEAKQEEEVKAEGEDPAPEATEEKKDGDVAVDEPVVAAPLEEAEEVGKKKHKEVKSEIVEVEEKPEQR